MMSQGVSSLETWASISDYAAELSEGNSDLFMRDVSKIFTGFTQELAPLNWAFQKIVGISPYKVSFRSDGFNKMFADPDENNDQVRHVWFYVQVSYTWGPLVAMVGNYFHEKGPGQGGKSDQDLWAGYFGALLGFCLDKGWLSPYEVGDWTRKVFGETTEAKK
jgi:hypothetical protein